MAATKRDSKERGETRALQLTRRLQALEDIPNGMDL